MRIAVWVLIAWLATSFWTAVASRLGPAHLLPDCAVIVVAFVALRREPIPVVLTAVLVGYWVGRQAAAPIGLHETALVLCAIAVYNVSGQLTGSGGLFFAFVSGSTVIGFHLAVFLLLAWVRGAAGFSSWATALYLPSAIATSLLAWVSYRPMLWLEGRLTVEQREGLQWR